MHRRLVGLLGFLVVVPTVQAQSASKRPLDHSAYEVWRGIDDEALSRDGAWLMYRLTLQDGDAELVLRDLASDTELRVARGANAAFTSDSRFVIATIAPELELVRAAKRAKKKQDDQPKDSLAIVDLSSRSVTRMKRVKSWRIPEERAGWVAYLVEPAAAAPDSAAPSDSASADANDDRPTSVLVVRDLTTGNERRFEDVSEYAWAKNGARLAFVTDGDEEGDERGDEDGGGEGDERGDGVGDEEGDDGDAVWVLEPGSGDPVQVASGAHGYKSVALAEAGDQLAVLAEQEDDEDDDRSTWQLLHWRTGQGAARVIAEAGHEGVPADWGVSEHEAPTFSRDGRRVLFATAPRVAPSPKDTLIDEEKVTVDIWHWEDPYLQPMQLKQLEQEQKRDYAAVVHLRSGRIVQLATPDVPEVTVGTHGNADVALGESNLPYRQLVSWDFPRYRDVYLVDVRSGHRDLVVQKTQGPVRLSPDAQYVTWYDNRRQAWFARTVQGGRPVNLTQSIPHPLYQEDHDEPYPAFPHGSAGWTTGDRAFLVYDRHDVWATDPTGRARARNVTDGLGRREDLRFRVIRLDPEQDAIDPDAPLLLAAFDWETKRGGYYRDRVAGGATPESLVFMERRFGTPIKAKDADVVAFTRQSVSEFPNLWMSDLTFRNARQVTDANPQQAEYRWATVELVEWTSVEGIPLQGLLYKPDDFDPTRQYPLLVNFYDRDSENLYTHYAPVPHRSSVRPIFYASRGYVVFIPDVVYETGWPGESALNAVVSGVAHLVDRGFIDEANIGVQGHSWGGYQIAYLVTRTDIFKAAAAGAPVANMTSAYGGIRWDTGLSRMFQYERTQSRIGASLWEAPMRYIDNSPLFRVDEVNTPVLIMHNDSDGHVPWYQGIELFVALRRLGKPAWLVNYNGERHWPLAFAERRDWNIRMQQFFDHFLKGAPAPVWLAEGVPATEKGKTLGLEVR